MKNDLKTAVVTGAGRGIGLAVAETLLKKGYNTVLAARNKTDAVAALEKEFSGSAIFVSADIGKAEGRKAIVDCALKNFQSADLLVNCAGVAPKVRKDMLEITEEDFDAVADINAKGTFFLTQQIAKAMAAAGGGRIINVGSVSADAVSTDRAEYCLSKAGVRAMTRLFAIRLAEYGIGVFEISPGIIQTDMIAPAREKYERLAEDGGIPARRLGSPDDVAKCAAAIADGMLDYASGTVIHCGGGLHIKRL